MCPVFSYSSLSFPLPGPLHHSSSCMSPDPPYCVGMYRLSDFCTPILLLWPS